MNWTLMLFEFRIIQAKYCQTKKYFTLGALSVIYKKGRPPILGHVLAVLSRLSLVLVYSGESNTENLVDLLILNILINFND